MKYSEYTDKEGRTQLSPEVIATNVQFLGKTKGKASEASAAESAGSAA